MKIYITGIHDISVVCKTQPLFYNGSYHNIKGILINLVRYPYSLNNLCYLIYALCKISIVTINIPKTLFKVF